MNNHGISIRVGDDRHVADGCFQRFKAERALVFLKACDSRVEIFYFETDRPAAWRGLPIRCAVPDPERVRLDIVFDEPLVSLSEESRFFEPQHALVEPACSLEVGNRITGKCDVGDLPVDPFFD